jgi:hypothetical protein
MKQVDLEPGQWAEGESKPQPPPPPPKYPRKFIFGLTDYGPQPVTWDMVLSLTVFFTIMYAIRHFW